MSVLVIMEGVSRTVITLQEVTIVLAIKDTALPQMATSATVSTCGLNKIN